MNSNERVNNKDQLSSLTTTNRPKSIGLHMGDPVLTLPGMVYLCPSPSISFSSIPYRTRYAFALLEDEEGGVCEVYPGWKEVYVHVAVSETEYRQTLKDLEVEEAKERKSRGEFKETAPHVPFDSSQVDPHIFSQLPNTAWIRVKRHLDDETRPSMHAIDTPLHEVLRKAGFGSSDEVMKEVARRAPKSLPVEENKKTPQQPSPKIWSLADLEERRKKTSEAIKRSWALRKENQAKLQPSKVVEGALNLNRAPQPSNGSVASSEESKEKVLLLDIQSSRTGYIDVRNAEIPSMQISLNFPRQYWLVEKVWNGVMWLCLQSKPNIGLPACEFWNLRGRFPGVKVVITKCP